MDVGIAKPREHDAVGAQNGCHGVQGTLRALEGDHTAPLDPQVHIPEQRVRPENEGGTAKDHGAA